MIQVCNAPVNCHVFVQIFLQWQASTYDRQHLANHTYQPVCLLYTVFTHCGRVILTASNSHSFTKITRRLMYSWMDG